MRVLTCFAVCAVLLGGCHPCSDNSSCPAGQVCGGGGCEPAMSATYSVTLHVVVAPKEPDGSDWDGATAFGSGSPPDPRANLTVATPAEGVAPLIVGFPTASDTFQAATTVSGVRFDQVDGGFDGGLMQLVVFDEDGVGTGDAICSAVVGPDAPTLLRAGAWDGGAQGSCTAISLELRAQ